MNPLILLNIVDGEDKSSQLKNRIRKNYQHLRKWAKRTGTDCFRIYDRDIKEYPLIIDFYAGRFCVHYISFDREKEPRADLKAKTDQALCSLFGILPDAIYSRLRIRRKKIEQYEKMAEDHEFFTATEYGIKFKINLVNYVDTGLFLDHRETRHMVGSLSRGKHVLNLFAYTCSFSVHAAMNGAASTKSVDLSNTYTAWGRDNFILNNIPLKNNEIVRADCLKFLDDERVNNARYDMIIIDPPTLSRSKKMDQLFDIQLDYISLITKALKLLAQDGIMIFSTNLKTFVFDMTRPVFASCAIKEITEKTIPEDFRNHKIHRTWQITKTG